MSARLVLTVKDSNRMAEGLSMSIMDKMFHPLKYNKMMNSKAKIGIFIDDEKEGTLYEASKTPYEISLTPGVHRISMIDPAKDSKKGNVNLMGSIIGFSAGSGLAEQISVGEIGKFLAGAMFKTGDGYLDLDLKDGDILKVQCQAGIGGKVSIKVLKIRIAKAYHAKQSDDKGGKIFLPPTSFYQQTPEEIKYGLSCFDSMGNS